MSNALTADQITELLASSRSRGEYDQFLKGFMESGDAGTLVDREGGILAGKSEDQAKVGLENAKKRTNDAGELVHKGANLIKVIKKEGQVYIIDTSKVEGHVPDSEPVAADTQP
jgi:hypothetical protein